MKLEELKDISDYWLAPDPKHLHIIVEFSSGKLCVHCVAKISLIVSRLSSACQYQSLASDLVVPAITGSPLAVAYADYAAPQKH